MKQSKQRLPHKNELSVVWWGIGQYILWALGSKSEKRGYKATNLFKVEQRLLSGPAVHAEPLAQQQRMPKTTFIRYSALPQDSQMCLF
jgi:hypothetical protein